MPREDATFGYRNPGIKKLPSSRYFFSTYEPLHFSQWPRPLRTAPRRYTRRIGKHDGG